MALLLPSSDSLFLDSWQIYSVPILPPKLPFIGPWLFSVSPHSMALQHISKHTFSNHQLRNGSFELARKQSNAFSNRTVNGSSAMKDNLPLSPHDSSTLAKK